MSRLSSIASLGLAAILGASCLAQNIAGQTAPQSPSDKPGERREAIIVLDWQSDYFGVTPAYMLLVYADGRVAFIGKKSVKTMGLVEGRIDKREVDRLAGEAKRINFFSLRDRYTPEEGCPASLTDASSVYISILTDGKRKSIDHYRGCSQDSKEYGVFPPELYALEELIDRVVNTDQWIK